MGMYYSTYFAFGVQVAANAYESDLLRRLEEVEDIDRLCTDLGVNYLLAGDYDRDRLFLTTHCEKVDWGEVKRVDPFSLGHQEGEWRERLFQAADRLGISLDEEPAWFVVPDVS